MKLKLVRTKIRAWTPMDVPQAITVLVKRHLQLVIPSEKQQLSLEVKSIMPMTPRS